MKHLRTTAAAGLVALLVACGGGTTDQNGLDPYADPGTPPPPPVENPTVHPTVRLSEPDSDSLIRVNVAGMQTGDGAALATAASDSDFTLVEDGVVKGITVEEIGGGVRAGADIVFVLDTTGSMYGAISSVRDGIIDFADYLEDSGLDVQLGTVTFGDAYDTVNESTESSGVSLRGDNPPSFDRAERPTFELTDDISAFQAFISEQEAVGGGIWPENSLGALDFAYDSMGWRSGAQCIMIVVTDAPAWSNMSPGDGLAGPAAEAWFPPDPDEVLSKVRGDCVVHVLGPDEAGTMPDSQFDMAELTGSGGTGGVFSELLPGEEFDFSELPVSDVLTRGFVVTYRGTTDGSEHEVRLVVDDGADTRGETTIHATY